jgi:uncharacterized membrane protein/thiol-disulfide isomerase/thioredoxin
MALESDVRSLIGIFLLVLALGACDAASEGDTQKAGASQGARPSAPAPAGKIDRTQAGAVAPDAAFADRGGKPLRIADFAGRPVLVNLWATWCAPCLAEMPALDRLAAREGDRLAVLAVSQDLEGWRAVDRFFVADKFKALTPYLDKENALALALGAKGLPMSILYDARGRELWRVNGPLEWDQPDVAALLPAAAPQRDDPWAEAKARGIEFRALGTEPGWTMEVDAGKRVALLLDNGERRLEVPAPRSWGVGAVSHAATAEGRSVAISAAPEPCNDGMSDTAYPASVTVTVDGKTYKGCGRNL